MCELCDARARKRAVDVVEDFKPVELPSNASSFIEGGGGLTSVIDSGDTIIGDINLEATNKRMKIEEDEDESL